MKIINHRSNLKPLTLETFKALSDHKESYDDKLSPVDEVDINEDVIEEEIIEEVASDSNETKINPTVVEEQNISQVRDLAYQEGFDAAKLIFEKQIESSNLEFEEKLKFYKKICDEIESIQKNQQLYIESSLAKLLDTLTLIASKFKIKVNFQEELKINCLDLLKNGYNDITIFYNFDKEIDLGPKINLIKDESLEKESYKIKFEDSNLEVNFTKIESEINNIIQKLNQKEEKVNP